jgi:hypothetical protein
VELIDHGGRYYYMHYMNNDPARTAERSFHREQLKADAPVAMAEYLAAEQAVRDRTARLRKERLAREARKARKK